MTEKESSMWQSKEELEEKNENKEEVLDLENIKTPPPRELWSKKLAIFLEEPKVASNKCYFK